MFLKSIDKISQRQKSRCPTDEEIRDDSTGLICCKNCGEPLQFEHRGYILPVTCRCEKEKSEESKAALAEFDREQRQNKLSEGIKAKAFKMFTFENDDKRNLEITKLCCQYVRHFGEMEKLAAGLLFYGDVGTGKTFYAGTIANALVKRGVPVLFTTLRELIDGRLSAKFKGTEAIDLNEFRLFLFDDIGSERLNKQDLDTAFSLIDDIYLLQKPIIVTTNLTMRQIEQPDSQELARIYSRLRERCPKAVFVSDSGHDRITAAKEKRKKMDEILTGK